MTLPSFESALWGAALAGAGFLLWLAGVSALRLKGGGLPMNAFPSARLVVGGIYGATSQPVYAGLTLMAAGAAKYVGCPDFRWVGVQVMPCAESGAIGESSRRTGRGIPVNGNGIEGTQVQARENGRKVLDNRSGYVRLTSMRFGLLTKLSAGSVGCCSTHSAEHRL